MARWILGLLLWATLAPAADVAATCDDLLAELSAKVPGNAMAAQMARAKAQTGGDEARAWALLGTGYAFLRQAEPALYAAAQAVKLQPTQAAWLNELGFLLVDQRRYDAADAILTAAGSAPTVQANLGKLRWRQGRKAEALVALKAAAADTSQPVYGYGYAKVLAAAGQQPAATSAVRDVLRRFPSYAPALALYTQLTGRSWERADLKALYDDALAYAAEVRAQLQTLQAPLDAISTGQGQEPAGTDTVNWYLAASDKMIAQLKARYRDATMTFEQFKAYARTKALTPNQQVYRSLLPLLVDTAAVEAGNCWFLHAKYHATANHLYQPLLHLWNNAPYQGPYIVSRVGYQFKRDGGGVTEPYDQWVVAEREAAAAVERARQAPGTLTHEEFQRIWCPSAGTAGRRYIREQPVRYKLTLPYLDTALRALPALDAPILQRFDAFQRRVQKVIGNATLKSAAASNSTTLAKFCDPTVEHESSGLNWQLKKQVESFQEIVAWHQRQMALVAGMIETNCGDRPQPDPSAADFEEQLRQFFAAWQSITPEGTTSSLTFGFVVCKVSVGSDGAVSIQAGEVGQVEGNYNLLNESYGFKFGVGVSADVGPFGAGYGEYLTWNNQSGWSQVGTASSSVGGVGLSRDYAWPASTFN